MPTPPTPFRFAPLALLAASLLCLTPAKPGRAEAPTVQDVCIGNGGPGPYALSWKHVQSGTETVQVNGLPQRRGLDYTLDTEGGTVTFTRDLSTQAAIGVTFQRDPSQAERNGQGQAIPLSVDLLRGEHGYFSFNALGKSGGADRGGLTLGMGMGLSGGAGTQVSTRFFFAPMTAAAGGGAASAWERTGVTVGGLAKAGDWGRFSFGLARAGVSLGDAGEDGPQAGQESLTLGSRLTPTRQVQAKFDYEAAKPTEGGSVQGTTKTDFDVTVTPNDRTQMQASLAQSAAGAGGTTQTLGLSASAQPTDRMQVSASYDGKNAPGTSGDSQVIALKTVLTPGKTFSLAADAGRTTLGTATTDQQAVSLTLTPRETLRLNAGLSLRQKSVAGADPVGTAVASVGGTLRPLSFLEFSGSYKSRMAPDTDVDVSDTFDTSAARVSLSPLRSIRFIGTYAQNPDDDQSVLQRLAKRGVGLETSLGALGLSGGYDWSRRYDSVDVEETIHADLGVRFSAATRLTVGFQTRQNRLEALAAPDTAYTVGFTHALGDRFSLDLNGKRKQSAAAQPDYDASANLGMKF